MSFRRPGKRSFFKYASPSTALAVLSSGKVRYSSPLTFNDPFDLQSGLHFEFDISTLHEKILIKLGQLAAAKTIHSLDENDPWGQVIKSVRDHYQTHGFPLDRFRELTGDLLKTMTGVIETTRQQFQEEWWKNLLPGLRVFCVSEDRDNLLMWAHYARDHTGAVFEFLSLPEDDNSLSVAEPITYADRPPPFFTENEWLDDILSVKKIDFNNLYKRYAYCKSDEWAYEREWRVWYPIVPAPTSLYEDIAIRKSEFASLYIGCKADNGFTTKALALARSTFPDVKVYKAKKCEDIYALEYAEI